MTTVRFVCLRVRIRRHFAGCQLSFLNMTESRQLECAIARAYDEPPLWNDLHLFLRRQLHVVSDEMLFYARRPCRYLREISFYAVCRELVRKYGKPQRSVPWPSCMDDYLDELIELVRCKTGKRLADRPVRFNYGEYECENL